VPADNWGQVEELFLTAVELPPSERDLFLRAECKGDTALRAEVEALLRADTDGPGFITDAIRTEIDSLMDAENPLIGTRVGAYRIFEEIGRGGMGTVYLGERDDEHFRKQVAIKVVKRGMDSAEVLARFRHERQILAGLEHPYIARLIDGGTTPDGRPFVVMEYVQGQPIDDYCREHKLDLRARLRLFLKVCEAVSYAHRALVVHRDLKPNNILVTEEGIPKLLDFGVAKLLDPGNDPGLTADLSGMGPITPEYASPEQITGLPITTAADIYSLGAVLFELLTGTRAQKIDTKTPTEIARVVCQEETPPPSTVTSAAGSTFKVDSELDNIVLMAMRKERERRYRSVNQFAEDITHYLQGRPVIARQDSLTYRSGKFLRRNGFAVAAAALVVASLLGGTAFSVMQARRAEAARQIAETQKQAAERERQRAETEKQAADRERARAEAQTQVAETERNRAEAQTKLAVSAKQLSDRRLTDSVEFAGNTLLDMHTKLAKLSGAMDVRREMVNRMVKFLEAQSKNAGDDDDLRFILGVSYLEVADVLGNPSQSNLGDTKNALENYKKSLALLDPVIKRHPDNPNYLQEWLEVRQSYAQTLAAAGDLKPATETLLGALPDARRLPKLCPKEPRCWMTEGTIYSELLEMTIGPNTADAFQYSVAAAEVSEKAHAAFPDDVSIDFDLATAYSQQAKLRNLRGENKEAVEEYRKAAALREAGLLLRPTDATQKRNLMITYGNMGAALGSPLFLNLGDTAGAKASYAKALAIARELAKADSTDQLAQSDLANALTFSAVIDVPKEELPDSLAKLEQAERIMQKLTTADPRSLARFKTLASIQQYKGRRLRDLDRNDEAIAAFRQSLELAKTNSSRSPTDITMLNQIMESEQDLAEVLAKTGDRANAVAAADDAVKRIETFSPPASEHDRISRIKARAYQTEGIVHAAFQEWDQATPAAERSVNEWHQLIAAKSRTVDPKKVARAEALLQECQSHRP
jgi:serine/threonine protein kinase/tetratricopeptide (TPR) repeat protein